MSTSNSIDFNQTRDQIIADSLSLLGKLGENETPSTAAITLGSNFLNKIVKHWETIGIHIWNESQCTVFLTAGVNKYTLSATGDKACDDSTLVETTVTTLSSGNSVTVNASTGMTNGDNIGIQLDDGTMQWTTIVSVNSLTSVTTTANLTTTAASGNVVFSFTTNLGRPLDILTGGVVRNASGFDRPIDMYGRREFMEIPNKSNQGSISAYYPSMQRDSCLIYTWCTPSVCSDRLKLPYERSIQDFDNGTDFPDFPQEWLLALTLTLAWLQGPAYGINFRTQLQDIPIQAQQALSDLVGWDTETSSVRIIPDYNR